MTIHIANLGSLRTSSGRLQHDSHCTHVSPPHSPSKLRRPGDRRYRHTAVVLSNYEKRLAVLVLFLILATMSCFGTAYYLSIIPWNHSTALPISATASNFSVDETLDIVEFGRESEPFSIDLSEKFLAYLPHSGFHNQRIAFENALLLSRLLNRTLLVPPIRLGNRPLYYRPFDELRQEVANSSKTTLRHCLVLPSDATDIYPECVDYSEYTYVPWDWLVNLTQIKREQRLVEWWNCTDVWLAERLQIGDNDTFTLKDASRNHYGFQDFDVLPVPIARKYQEFVPISSLSQHQDRLLMLGTLFGSSRFYLRHANNYLLRKHIRQSMALTNPILIEIADQIHGALGGQYLAAHVRLGDGLFQKNAHENVRLIWWKLLHFALGFSIKDAMVVEKTLFYAQADAQANDSILTPPRIPIDSPALRSPHPPLPPLPYNPQHSLKCPGEVHTSIHLRILNTPLFISTDIDDPLANPMLSRFTQTFPCTFFLADFVNYTSALDPLRSGYDGVMLKPFLIPFLDAMVASRAWQVVGTEQSTFSAYVQDVLWRTYHGWDIVHRG